MFNANIAIWQIRIFQTNYLKTPKVKTPEVKTPEAKKRVTFDVTESDSFLSGLKTKIKGESEINYKSEINGDNLTLILKELSTIKENQLKKYLVLIFMMVLILLKVLKMELI